MRTEELLPRQVAEAEDQYDPLVEATIAFEEAAQYLDLEGPIVQRLRQAEREITTNVQCQNHDGEAVTVSGFRVQHYAGGRPTLGPVQLSPEASLHAVKAAAMNSTWQMALVEAAFGGSAGAVLCDPERLAESELHETVHAYARSLRGLAGAFSDVLSPGRGCNPQTMAWMLAGSYEQRLDTGAIVGKPAALWGVPDFYDAAAQGMVALLEEALDGLREKRVSVQGFGRTGAGVARLLRENGARVVALADGSGGLYRDAGIDVAAAEEHARHKGVLFGFERAESTCNADVLEADCHALVLTAAERQVNAANAERIRARVLIEGITGAVTGTAERMLSGSGGVVVPCLLATAGEAVAGEVEWARCTNPAVGYVELGPVVAERMRATWQKVSAYAEEHRQDLRRASLLLAVERVAAQMRNLA